MTELYANTYAPPDWLDKQFLERVLKDRLGEHRNVKILHCNIKPATNVGDNFISQMFRITGTFSSKNSQCANLSLVIKSLPKGAYIEKFVQEYNFFKRERIMLSETLPAMHSILNEFGDFPRFFANVYFHQGPPNDLIILEDLRQGGFNPPDRLKGLDIDHCKLVVEALATYHAASLVAVKRNPKLKEQHSYIYWHRNNYDGMLKRFIVEGFDSLSKLVVEWPEFPEGFSETILQKRDRVAEKILDACDRKDDDYNVILHGDSWTSNFMFKYENGFPVALKFVDFQNSCYHHPTIDLLYFLFSSPSNKLKIKHNDMLLRCYYQKMIEVCNILRYDINWEYDDFHSEFVRRISFGFMTAITIFPFTTAPSSEAVELDAFLGESCADSSKKSQYETDTYKEGIRMMLPYFIEQGVFD